MDENTRAMLEHLEGFIELARRSGITTQSQSTTTTSTSSIPNVTSVTSSSTTAPRSSAILSELSRIGSRNDVRREVASLFSPQRNVSSNRSENTLNAPTTPASFNPVAASEGRRSRAARRSLSRGSRFTRTFVLLPSPLCNFIPRGAFRDHLSQQNLLADVTFRSGQNSSAIRQQIILSYQRQGHLEDTRNLDDFLFLVPSRDNRSILEPLGESHQQMTASLLQNRWRSDRTIYIRPLTLLSSYRLDSQFPLTNERNQTHRAVPTQSSETTTTNTTRTSTTDRLTSVSRNEPYSIIDDSDPDENPLQETIMDTVIPAAVTSTIASSILPRNSERASPELLVIDSDTSQQRERGAEVLNLTNQREVNGPQIDMQGQADAQQLEESIRLSCNTVGSVETFMRTPSIRATVGFSGSYATQQEVMQRLQTECGNALPLFHAVPLENLTRQVIEDRKLLFVLVLSSQTSNELRSFISSHGLIRSLNAAGYAWCVQFQDLCEVSSLHINVDRNSDESSLHILYPSSAGHMETVGSFFGIDETRDGRSMLDAIDRQIMEAERRLAMANESRARAQLIAAQNEEYNASLSADMERTRGRSSNEDNSDEERNERQQHQLNGDAVSADMPSSEGAETLESTREVIRQGICPEPDEGLRLRLINIDGESIIRRFNPLTTCELLYRVVFATFQVPANFTIVYVNRTIPQVENVSIGDILTDQSTLRIRF